MRRVVKVILIVAVVILIAGGVSFAEEGLTADQILDRMDEASDRVSAGSLVSKVRFDNAYSDGTTTSKLFGILSRPGRSLICFLEPEAEAGSIFLTVKEEGVSRMWIYLPLLGIPKELVSEEERSGSFAGSSLSYEDIGSEDRRADYDATLIGTEELTIGDRVRTAYVIESTAKPDADVEEIRTVMWVDSEYFILLRIEGYNDLGNLSTTMEVLSLGEFEDRLIAEEILSQDLGAGITTTITFLGRWRPDEEIPGEVFLPENLPDFDPAEWGLIEEG